MISKDQVQHVAKLARLELTEEEIEKMQKDLSGILDYFNVLKEVKGKVKKVTSQKENSLRNDEYVEENNNLAANLIEAAPDKKEGYIKVKTVF